MDSSSNRAPRSRPRRQTALSPETLEGRQLLSTAATDTGAVSTTAATPTSADVSLTATTTAAPTPTSAAPTATTTLSSTPIRFARAGHAVGFNTLRMSRNHRFAASPMVLTSNMLPFESLPGSGSITTPANPATSTATATPTAGSSFTTLPANFTLTPPGASSGAIASGTVAPGTAPSTSFTTMPGQVSLSTPNASSSAAAPTSFTTLPANVSPNLPSASGVAASPFLPAIGPQVGIGGAGGGFQVGVARGFATGWLSIGGPMAGQPTGSASTDPGLAAMQQYGKDTQAIADKSQVTPALQAALRKDLQALNADATTAPDRAKVLAFESDVATLAGTLPTSAGLAMLQADFTAVATSEGVTDSAAIAQAFTDLNALITATNITASDVTTLSADLKAAGQSTAAPLGPGLGIDLGLLNLAIKMDAGSTTTAPASGSTSGSSGTTTTTTTATS